MAYYEEDIYFFWPHYHCLSKNEGSYFDEIYCDNEYTNVSEFGLPNFSLNYRNSYLENADEIVAPPKIIIIIDYPLKNIATYAFAKKEGFARWEMALLTSMCYRRLYGVEDRFIKAASKLDEDDNTGLYYYKPDLYYGKESDKAEALFAKWYDSSKEAEIACYMVKWRHEKMREHYRQLYKEEIYEDLELIKEIQQQNEEEDEFTPDEEIKVPEEDESTPVEENKVPKKYHKVKLEGESLIQLAKWHEILKLIFDPQDFEAVPKEEVWPAKKPSKCWNARIKYDEKLSTPFEIGGHIISDLVLHTISMQFPDYETNGYQSYHLGIDT